MRSVTVPFRIDGSGGLSSTSSEYEITVQRLMSIVLTNKGERPMRSIYGAGVQGMVFENLEIEEVQATIQAELDKHEPGSRVSSLTIERNPLSQSEVVIEIGIILGNSRYTLVHQEDI